MEAWRLLCFFVFYGQSLRNSPSDGAKLMHNDNADLKYENIECSQLYFDPYGNFTSPGYPKELPSTYRECMWDIKRGPDERIFITFPDVDLPMPERSGVCSAAFISWGGYDHQGRQVVEGKTCGDDAPADYRSNTGQAWVKLVVTGRSKQDVYKNHRGLHFSFITIHSDLRLNHMIVGLVLALTIPAVCCTPMIWYYKKMQKSRTDDVARVIAREKFYRKKMVKKVLSQSQQVMSTSGDDTLARMYGVSAYMYSQDGTTFESVEAEKAVQEVLDKRRKVEALLTAINHRGPDGPDEASYRKLGIDPLVDPRCQIYRIKPDYLSPITTDGKHLESTPFPHVHPKMRTSSLIPSRTPDTSLDHSAIGVGLCGLDISRGDGCIGDDSVFQSVNRVVSFKQAPNRRYGRRKMSLAYSAPSLGSISEIEEFIQQPQEMRKNQDDTDYQCWNTEPSDVKSRADDSVFIRDERSKSVRFAEESPSIISDGECRRSGANSVQGSERNFGEEDSDDAIFFDAESSIDLLGNLNEEYVDDISSLPHGNSQELNSETESADAEII